MPRPPERAPLDVGALAPDVRLTDSLDRIVSLTDFRGEPLLVVFFPGGWDPARREHVAFYSEIVKNAGSGVRALGISYDGAWCEVETDDDALRFPLLNDTSVESEAARSFGVEGVEAAFVIDGQGIVRWRQVGAAPQPGELCAQLTGPIGGAPRLTRREFLMSTVALSMLAAAPLPRARAQDAPRARTGEPNARTVVLNVNGADRRIAIDPRVTLLDALRERMGLFGTKKGCDHGQCGACTVHVDGRRVNACLMLAMQAEGSKIVTIEGLARGSDLHPVQAAFIEADGFQCGYCTSGQIMSAVACIAEGHAGSEDEIREWMSGNICRCGAYRGICKAIAQAQGRSAA